MPSLQEQLLKLGLVDQPEKQKPKPRPSRRSTPPADGRRLTAKQLAARGALDKTEGRKRFYFERRSDVVSYLELNDATVTKLERGQAAIVEAPSGHLTIVDGGTGAQLTDSAPDWVRFFRA